MSTDFGQYLDRLKTVGDDQLDRSVTELARTEKESMAQLIAHLAEMAERKIHRKLGFSSLFDYAVVRLGLSPGSAWLRLQVAGVARRFPQVLAALADGRLSLTVAGHLSRYLTAENLEVVFRDCTGMTTRQVKEYVARFRPKPLANPSIRKRPELKAAAPTAGGPALAGAELPLPSAAATGDAPPEAEAPPASAPLASDLLLPAAPPPAPGRLDPASPDTYNVRFGAERALIEKLERFAAVAGFHSPVRDIARIIERALDVALEVKDPERREARRRRRAERRAAQAAHEEAARAREEATVEAAPEEQPPRSAVDRGPEKTRPHEADEVDKVDKPTPPPEPARSRTILRAVRDRVLARAGHQCEFTSADGRRCTARTALEIEHEEPFAIFRRHDESRMRAFCRSHNQLRAEEVYGAEFIRRKIEARRRSAESSRVEVAAQHAERMSPSSSVPP